MSFRRMMILGALASCSLLAAGANAQANYTYTTSNVSVTSSGLDGLGVTAAPLSGAVGFDFPVTDNLVSLGYSNIATGNTAFMGTITVTFNETLASMTTGTSASFAVTETLGVVDSAAGIALQTITATIVPTATGGFSLTQPNYIKDPTTATAALLGFTITVPTAAVVPEPTGIVLMGMGVVGAIGFGVRRSRKAKA
jgi:hypothetical protein